MTPPPIDVGSLAARCLTAVVTHAHTHDWPLPLDSNGVEACYVAAGSPNDIAAPAPPDGPHLVVMLDSLNPGATDNTSRGGAVQSKGVSAVIVPRATLVLRLLRCVAVADEYGTPSLAELHTDGLDLLNDVGRVLSALYAWRRDENGRGANGPVTLGQVESTGPGGGLAGHMFWITVSPVQ